MTTTARPTIERFIQQFSFRPLFIELGWERLTGQEMVEAAGQQWTLERIAEKRKRAVFLCTLPTIPDVRVRHAIDRALIKLFDTHIVIFADTAKTQQVWLYPQRSELGPKRMRAAEYIFARGQHHLLVDRVAALEFALTDEATLMGVEVDARMTDNKHAEAVTKKFYKEYVAKHEELMKLIAGLPDSERGRYASLLLNRLMFTYFIQQKGFLRPAGAAEGDKDYLRKQLDRCGANAGAGSFFVYYKNFLVRLFHEGLGRKAEERSAEVRALIGEVPYLNGGLFERHPLERDHADLDVPDEAFASIFDLFDRYRWFLDDRPLRDEHEINPDVLGYIFEKFINQKQMGAYYTKEDITDYISKNTIIPYIFEAAQPQCAIAFEPPSQNANSLWKLLMDDPDRYIYPAVRRGMGDGDPQPPVEILAGEADVAARGGWNRPAFPDLAGDPARSPALPTETWREYMARRARCRDLRARLRAGEVTTINDLITLNLDITRFAQDVIEQGEGSNMIDAFYEAIARVTVLDPTCGSGAFLFAALGILGPLYEACLTRMEGFVALDDARLERKEGGPSPHLPKFRTILASVATHPNRLYFILKAIIVNNLYGVDIMPDAVEIAKLRLFLKLVAQVPEGDVAHVEPLPDIDFNIRTGNTLVGYTAYSEIEAGMKLRFDERNENVQKMREIDEEIKALAGTLAEYRRQQLVTQVRSEGNIRQVDKITLRTRMAALAEKLDQALAWEYAVSYHDATKFADWRASHQPFHWFAEFNAIMKDGGFDVIIGNPPYIQYRRKNKKTGIKLEDVYKLKGYETIQCPDVYAYVMERCGRIAHAKQGHFGMIVPLSFAFGDDFGAIRSVLYKQFHATWFSSFARIPAALFSAETRVRNTVFIAARQGNPVLRMTTVLHRWFEQARPTLFAQMSYAPFSPSITKGMIPRYNTPELARAFEAAFRQTPQRIEMYLQKKTTPHILYFKKSAYNWLTFCKVQPPCYDGENVPIPHTEFGAITFKDDSAMKPAFLLLNGKLIFSFWSMIGDDFHVARWMFADFPIDLAKLSTEQVEKLNDLYQELEQAMQSNVSYKRNAGKLVGNYNLARCRHITDRSDAIFADALGFTGVWQDIELLYAQIVKTDFSTGEIADDADEDESDADDGAEG